MASSNEKPRIWRGWWYRVATVEGAVSEKSWLERKMDEADAYKAKFSAWDDFKFTLAGLFGIAWPVLIIALLAALILSILSI